MMTHTMTTKEFLAKMADLKGWRLVETKLRFYRGHEYTLGCPLTAVASLGNAIFWREAAEKLGIGPRRAELIANAADRPSARLRNKQARALRAKMLEAARLEEQG